mgnify:CR=1 FL=1
MKPLRAGSESCQQLRRGEFVCAAAVVEVEAPQATADVGNQHQLVGIDARLVVERRRQRLLDHLAAELLLRRAHRGRAALDGRDARVLLRLRVGRDVDARGAERLGTQALQDVRALSWERVVQSLVFVRALGLGPGAGVLALAVQRWRPQGVR